MTIRHPYIHTSIPWFIGSRFTGHRWIPRTKASDAELSCFLRSAPWINGWVNNHEAGDLWRHRAHYDVIVIFYNKIAHAYGIYCIVFGLFRLHDRPAVIVVCLVSFSIRQQLSMGCNKTINRKQRIMRFGVFIQIFAHVLPKCILQSLWYYWGNIKRQFNTCLKYCHYSIFCRTLQSWIICTTIQNHLDTLCATEQRLLTHWGRVTHICASKLTIIGSDNSLSPGRRQAIIWTNAGIMLIGPLGTNFSEILNKI